jgi:hypothetical protein
MIDLLPINHQSSDLIITIMMESDPKLTITDARRRPCDYKLWDLEHSAEAGDPPDYLIRGYTYHYDIPVLDRFVARSVRVKSDSRIRRYLQVNTGDILAVAGYDIVVEWENWANTIEPPAIEVSYEALSLEHRIALRSIRMREEWKMMNLKPNVETITK